jgi:hypothetical protein
MIKVRSATMQMPIGSAAPSSRPARSGLPGTRRGRAPTAVERTTFVLDDSAGGWYACVDRGRYA